MEKPIETIDELLVDAERLNTWKHMHQVRRYLKQVTQELEDRALHHDLSKLDEPEAEAFAKANMGMALHGITYGSDEYKQRIKEILGSALEHHYAENAHHPEYHMNGVDDMTLIDLMEMLADWKAATLRHNDGDIMRSLEINKERFGLSPQLAMILANTVRNLDWDQHDEI
jgi:hypothetical protein